MVKENIIKLIVAKLSKCHYPGKTNSVQEGPNVGLPCRQGHGGTVPHYYLVYLCTYFGSAGVLPEVLYHLCGSAPRKVVQCFWEYSCIFKKWYCTTFAEALPQNWYSTSRIQIQIQKSLLTIELNGTRTQ